VCLVPAKNLSFSRANVAAPHRSAARGIDTTGTAWPVRMTNAPETAIVAVG